MKILRVALFSIILFPSLSLLANEAGLIARGGEAMRAPNANEARIREDQMHRPVDSRLNNPYDKGAVQGYERGVNNEGAANSGGGNVYVVPPAEPQNPQ